MLSWYRFWAVTKKFVFTTRTKFWAANFWAYAPGYYLTFVSLALFDLSDGKNSKKSIFANCSVLTDFFHYLHLPLNLFLFLVLLGERAFQRSCYSCWCFNGCFIYVRTEPKWICYFDCTNVANENCVEFCMKEVFKCRKRRMM